jgi:Transposase Tn5 dimerisation domain/Transposase DNA-binding
MERGQQMRSSSLFGDIRLDKRLAVLTDQLSANPGMKLSQVFKRWSSLKAGYEFLNNDRVSHAGIMQTEKQATLQRLNGTAGMILAVQDTTSFNFGNRQEIAGMGVVEDNRTAGFFAHTTLLVSEEGVPLGVLEQQVWSRKQSLNRDPKGQNSKPINEKESYKWLKGLPQVDDVKRQVVTICDREADIYEVFQMAHQQQVDFIIRVKHNRSLEDVGLLHDHLNRIEVAETSTITVQRQRDQAERDAQVALRYTQVTLLPPAHQAKTARYMELTPLTLQVVEVREIHVPADVQEPIHWILVTSLPVASPQDAHRIVRFYTYRWLVERFHFVLKTGGCHFEDTQLRSLDALHRWLALCSCVAWRLLWLTYQARHTPEASCTLALTPDEWQALTAFSNRSPFPDASPPTLRQAVRAIAKLGGFIGRASDGEPGVKTLWRGWQRLQDIVATWNLFHIPPISGND